VVVVVVVVVVEEEEEEEEEEDASCRATVADWMRECLPGCRSQLQIKGKKSCEDELCQMDRLHTTAEHTGVVEHNVVKRPFAVATDGWCLGDEQDVGRRLLSGSE
jgi:hypothetical protein